MQVTMKVAKVSFHPKSVSVDVGGETVNAEITEMQVELVSDEGQGSWILHFSKPSEVAEAQRLFEADKLVTFSF